MRDEFDIWVIVVDIYEYMFCFFYNFNVLLLGIMGIIMDDFWGFDGKWDILGYCNKVCVKFVKF